MLKEEISIMVYWHCSISRQRFIDQKLNSISKTTASFKATRYDKG